MSITLQSKQNADSNDQGITANELAPLDMEIDQRGDYTDGLFQKVVDTGLLGMTLPREFGGAGFDYVATAQALEHMAAGNASMAVTLEGHFKTIEQFIKYGNKALNDAYLPSATNGFLLFR